MSEKKARALLYARSNRVEPQLVPCACYCGTLIDSVDSKGRPRRFAGRHRLDPQVAAAWSRLFGPDSPHDPGCWEWQAATNERGYGLTKRNGENYAHRAAWVQVNGPIPELLDVLHRCDNPPCIRPSHLFLGTDADNVADMILKGRQNYAARDLANCRIPVEVVQRIRERRADGLSLRTVGREFGVSSSYVLWVTVGGGRP